MALRVKRGTCKNCKTSDIEFKIKNLCSKCYRETLRCYCDFCGKFNVISTKKKGKIVCASCNKKFNPVKKKKCSICNKIGRIDKILGSKPICMTCNEKYFYKRPKSVCFICGKFKIRDGFREGKPICQSCYKINYSTKSKKNCDNCGNKDYIYLVKKGKKFCGKCYRRLRKDYYYALEHTRKAKIKRTGGKISEEEFKTIRKRDKKCVYCGKKDRLSFDHIIPVSKGGRSDFNNYVLACLSCNISKGKKDVFEWCKQKGIEVPGIINQLLEK